MKPDENDPPALDPDETDPLTLEWVWLEISTAARTRAGWLSAMRWSGAVLIGIWGSLGVEKIFRALNWTALVPDDPSTVGDLLAFSAFAIPMGCLAGLFIVEVETPDDPRTVIRRRIEGVNRAFRKAANLMDELQQELETQEAARQKLLADAEEQQRLLDISEEQAEKVRQILLSDAHRDRVRQRRREVAFFAAGLLASIPIGILVNLIS